MKTRQRPSAALIISIMALISSLGGTAWAAGLISGKQIKNNAISSKHIKNRQVKLADLAANSVNSTAIAPDSVLGSDVRDGEVTGADIKDEDVAGADIKNGDVASADLKDGDVAEDDLSTAVKTKLNTTDTSPWEKIPSGQTVTGGFYHYYNTVATGYSHVANMQLPALPPSAFDVEGVNFAADSNPTTTDDSALCTGTSSAPTAPAGKICLYLTTASGVTNLNALGWTDAAHREMGLWYLTWSDTNAAGAATQFWGTWAYTAP